MKSIKKITTIIAILSVIIIIASSMNALDKIESKSGMVKSENNGFAVVELFTSEGCSSCPPADKLLAGIQQENSKQSIYILAFHVDYWDHQGWKDSYSNADYSARQKKYADWLHLNSVYTPQIVVNGTTEFVGSDEQALKNAIREGLQAATNVTLAVTAKTTNNQVSVEYETNSQFKQNDVVIALIQKSGQSSVRAGENKGRLLSHVQIVRKLAIETIRAKSGKITLDLPKDAGNTEWSVISFVQDKSKGSILAASKVELVISSDK